MVSLDDYITGTPSLVRRKDLEGNSLVLAHSIAFSRKENGVVSLKINAKMERITLDNSKMAKDMAMECASSVIE